MTIIGVGILTAAEVLVLYDLYTSFAGEDWNWSKRSVVDSVVWSFASISFDVNDSSTYPNPCDTVNPWHGISCLCETSICHITNLDLRDISLKGSISEFLNVVLPDLSQLTHLQLTSNYFTGSLPVLTSTSSTILSSSSLSHLYLGNNRISGSLSSGWLCNGQLVVLQLQKNYIHGAIDSSECTDSVLSTSLLADLDLSYNLLSGKLSFLFEMSTSTSYEHIRRSLRFVNVAHNCLYRKSILPQLSSVFCNSTYPLYSNIQHLYFSSLYDDSRCIQEYSEQRVSDIGKVGKWWYTDMRFIFAPNRLTVPFPTCLLSSLPSLQTLHLANNGLFGALVSEGESISSKLSSLDVSFNHLSGSIPYAVQYHTHWQTLALQHNHLTGNLSPSFPTSENITELKLDNNDLSGVIPWSMINERSNKLEYVSVLQGNLFACTPILSIGWSEGHLNGQSSQHMLSGGKGIQYTKDDLLVAKFPINDVVADSYGCMFAAPLLLNYFVYENQLNRSLATSSNSSRNNHLYENSMFTANSSVCLCIMLVSFASFWLLGTIRYCLFIFWSYHTAPLDHHHNKEGTSTSSYEKKGLIDTITIQKPVQSTPNHHSIQQVIPLNDSFPADSDTNLIAEKELSSPINIDAQPFTNNSLNQHFSDSASAIIQEEGFMITIETTITLAYSLVHYALTKIWFTHWILPLGLFWTFVWMPVVFVLNGLAKRIEPTHAFLYQLCVSQWQGIPAMLILFVVWCVLFACYMSSIIQIKTPSVHDAYNRSSLKGYCHGLVKYMKKYCLWMARNPRIWMVTGLVMLMNQSMHVLFVFVSASSSTISIVRVSEGMQLLMHVSLSVYMFVLNQIVIPLVVILCCSSVHSAPNGGTNSISNSADNSNTNTNVENSDATINNTNKNNDNANKESDLFDALQANHNIQYYQLRRQLTMLLIVHQSIIAPIFATIVTHPQCFLYLLWPQISGLEQLEDVNSNDVEGFQYSFQCSDALLTSYATVILCLYLLDMFILPLIQDLLYVFSSVLFLILQLINVLLPYQRGIGGETEQIHQQPAAENTKAKTITIKQDFLVPWERFSWIDKQLLEADIFLIRQRLSFWYLFTWGVLIPPLGCLLLTAMLCDLRVFQQWKFHDGQDILDRHEKRRQDPTQFLSPSSPPSRPAKSPSSVRHNLSPQPSKSLPAAHINHSNASPGSVIFANDSVQDKEEQEVEEDIVIIETERVIRAALIPAATNNDNVNSSANFVSPVSKRSKLSSATSTSKKERQIEISEEQRQHAQQFQNLRPPARAQNMRTAISPNPLSTDSKTTTANNTNNDRNSVIDADDGAKKHEYHQRSEHDDNQVQRFEETDGHKKIDNTEQQMLHLSDAEDDDTASIGNIDNHDAKIKKVLFAEETNDSNTTKASKNRSNSNIKSKKHTATVIAAQHNQTSKSRSPPPTKKQPSATNMTNNTSSTDKKDTKDTNNTKSKDSKNKINSSNSDTNSTQKEKKRNASPTKRATIAKQDSSTTINSSDNNSNNHENVSHVVEYDIHTGRKGYRVANNTDTNTDTNESTKPITTNDDATHKNTNISTMKNKKSNNINKSPTSDAKKPVFVSSVDMLQDIEDDDVDDEKNISSNTKNNSKNNGNSNNSSSSNNHDSKNKKVREPPLRSISSKMVGGFLPSPTDTARVPDDRHANLRIDAHNTSTYNTNNDANNNNGNVVSTHHNHTNTNHHDNKKRDIHHNDNANYGTNDGTNNTTTMPSLAKIKVRAAEKRQRYLRQRAFEDMLRDEENDLKQQQRDYYYRCLCCCCARCGNNTTNNTTNNDNTTNDNYINDIIVRQQKRQQYLIHLSHKYHYCLSVLLHNNPTTPNDTISTGDDKEKDDMDSQHVLLLQLLSLRQLVAIHETAHCLCPLLKHHNNIIVNENTNNTPFRNNTSDLYNKNNNIDKRNSDNASNNHSTNDDDHDYDNKNSSIVQDPWLLFAAIALFVGCFVMDIVANARLHCSNHHHDKNNNNNNNNNEDIVIVRLAGANYVFPTQLVVMWQQWEKHLLRTFMLSNCYHDDRVESSGDRYYDDKNNYVHIAVAGSVENLGMAGLVWAVIAVIIMIVLIPLLILSVKYGVYTYLRNKKTVTHLKKDAGIVHSFEENNYHNDNNNNNNNNDEESVISKTDNTNNSGCISKDGVNMEEKRILSFLLQECFAGSNNNSNNANSSISGAGINNNTTVDNATKWKLLRLMVLAQTPST